MGDILPLKKSGKSKHSVEENIYQSGRGEGNTPLKAQDITEKGQKFRTCTI